MARERAANAACEWTAVEQVANTLKAAEQVASDQTTGEGELSLLVAKAAVATHEREAVAAVVEISRAAKISMSGGKSYVLVAAKITELKAKATFEAPSWQRRPAREWKKLNDTRVTCAMQSLILT